MRSPWLFALAAAVSLMVPADGFAQERSREIAGVPALNYDSDEGFGYGAIVELYGYRSGALPYLYTIQPTVFLTTGGRRDFTVFFDSPHLLPGGWRIDAYAGSEEQIASPYYGVGNASAKDDALVTDASPYYYRFGRLRRQATANVQHAIGGLPLRLLMGAGLAHVQVTPVPRSRGTTLLEGELAGSEVGGWTSYARAGLVWDTRDRETGPTRGSWSELLVQRFDGALGSDYEYTRWTLADRRYSSLGSPRLVLANRLLLQAVSGDAPFYDLFVVQTSFKQQEGLGGAKTLRGVPKNRYVGEAMFLWNLELRWRASDFTMLGRSSHVVLSTFLDQGRVWAAELELGDILSDLHRAVGGGVRLGVGENFVVAFDVGHSAEAAAPFYIGLNYLF